MKVLLVIVAAGAALVVAAGGALLLFSLALLGADAGDPEPASQQALDNVPADVLVLYQSASRQCNMRWAVLAAVGKIESDHGRSAAPGIRAGANGAGAMGPMQFLSGTWAVYGVDGDDDGVIDVYNTADAIWGAASYLCGNGAGDANRTRSALWNYNHADWYVDQVLALAATYEVAVVGSGNVRSLIDNPSLSLTPTARQDLLAGLVDQRVVDFLAWAVARHTISVSVLKSGHAKYVADSSRVSDHWYGRAVDIYAVDGQLVASGSSAARRLAIEVTELMAGRPDEIGLPWPDLTGRRGAFADADHLTHLHLGWNEVDLTREEFPSAMAAAPPLAHQ